MRSYYDFVTLLDDIRTDLMNYVTTSGKGNEVNAAMMLQNIFNLLDEVGDSYRELYYSGAQTIEDQRTLEAKEEP